jgi:hypothetical protein
LAVDTVEYVYADLSVVEEYEGAYRKSQATADKYAAKSAEEYLAYRPRIIVKPPLFTGGQTGSVLLERLRRLSDYTGCADLAEHIILLRESGFARIVGGARLNVTNTSAARHYAESGLSDLITSPELNSKARLKSAIPLGFIGYGYLPLLSLCGVNDSSTDKYTDSKGVTFRAKHNENYTEVLNSVPMILSDKLGSFKGYTFTVLAFAPFETDIKRVLGDYTRSAAPTGRFTRGLYFKRVS